MRLGVWQILALGLGLFAGACSGGYPLPPTLCDDYCDATKGGCEDFYEPAGCVADCEQQQLDREACRPLFDAVVTCFRNTPGAVADECDFSSNRVHRCSAEYEGLLECVLPNNGGFSGPPHSAAPPSSPEGGSSSAAPAASSSTGAVPEPLP